MLGQVSPGLTRLENVETC